MIADIAYLIFSLVALGSLGLTIYNTLIIREVKHATNSMKDELVAVTAASSEAIGVLKEKERQESIKTT